MYSCWIDCRFRATCCDNNTLIFCTNVIRQNATTHHNNVVMRCLFVVIVNINDTIVTKRFVSMTNERVVFVAKRVVIATYNERMSFVIWCMNSIVVCRDCVITTKQCQRFLHVVDVRCEFNRIIDWFDWLSQQRCLRFRVATNWTIRVVCIVRFERCIFVNHNVWLQFLRFDFRKMSIHVFHITIMLFNAMLSNDIRAKFVFVVICAIFVNVAYVVCNRTRMMYWRIVIVHIARMKIWRIVVNVSRMFNM